MFNKVPHFRVTIYEYLYFFFLPRLVLKIYRVIISTGIPLIQTSSLAITKTKTGRGFILEESSCFAKPSRRRAATHGAATRVNASS